MERRRRRRRLQTLDSSELCLQTEWTNADEISHAFENYIT
jgi:hypothetical protein